MNFLVNLNGSSAASIRDQLIAVGDAAQALEKAIAELRGDAFHGRNYPQENGATLRSEELAAAARMQMNARAVFDWAAVGVGDLIRQREGL